MIEDVTGIILAGGESRRFGSNKALAPWQGKTMIESVVKILNSLFPQTLVVAKDPSVFSFVENDRTKGIKDIFSDQHALGGLFSGLSASPTTRCFVCACDMPFLQTDLIRTLTQAAPQAEAVVPLWKNKIQPLCAVYSIACLETINRLINEGRYKMQTLFDLLKTKIILEEEIKAMDPAGLSFFDIDTRADYETAQLK